LGAVVLIVVVAVTVGATLLFTGGGSSDDPPTATSSTPTTSGVASDIASANDKGPVEIITDDPTCAPWTPINDTLANRQDNGWRNRDSSVPAVAWSADVRAIFQEVGAAFDAAADQTVPLVKLTPHRVMRELYEQFIAYARAYADSLPTYTEPDNHLATVAVAATLALTYICNADKSGSAAARAPLVGDVDAPSTTSTPRPVKPTEFLASSNPVCREWSTAVNQFNTDVAEWTKTDPTIPVAQWSPELKSLTEAAVPVLGGFADTMQTLALRSENPTLQDFAALSAVYLDAFVKALPTYVPNDQYLYSVAMQASALINEACLAVES
jgi:hypothetical protein